MKETVKVQKRREEIEKDGKNLMHQPPRIQGDAQLRSAGHDAVVVCPSEVMFAPCTRLLSC